MNRRRDAQESWIASDFVNRVLIQQLLVGVVEFAVMGLLAPWALMLESQWLAPLALAGVQIALFAFLMSALLSWQRLRTNREVLRAVAAQSDTVQAADIGALADLPFALTWRFVLVNSLAASLILVPALRPPQLDSARANSLALLALTIVAAAAVVHYVIVRESTLRVIELSPLEPITAWLEHQAVRLAPQQRLIRKILLAVVVPVALVGVGTLLVTHAHLRAFVERSRTKTARVIARTTLEVLSERRSDTGREDAVADAAAHGFIVNIERGIVTASAEEQAQRLDGGQLEVAAPVEDGRAVVRYSAVLAPQVITTGALLALLAALIAAALGGAFGSAVAADLQLATRQVSALGTERVLRGKARVAGVVRFRVVAALGRSVEALADRFRVFAAAQERALRAREAAQRMKQLLFASVSHDLKTPLNAILGFAELVHAEPLTPAQAENAGMVYSRGRELLAMIETILDAARVEAGQLRLSQSATEPDVLVQEAVVKAYDLLGERSVEVVAEIAPALPPLHVDVTHASRALAVLITNALESASTGPGRMIRIRGTMPATRRGSSAPADAVAFHIEYVAHSHRPSLLELQLAGKSRSDSGRGMVLRLSLARAIIELHGGRVDVGRGPHGAAVVTCWLPIHSARA